ncbi:MAG: hypothetical protein B7Z02_04290 [Rhodobacterales bacterium 32-67-9]|nr:MAG: hypothetical protein B7Z02_04290 [Rhodobacterales bacterium 32-67-9]
MAGAALAAFALMALAGPMSCGGVWWSCSFDARILPYGADAARDYLAAARPALWRYLWIVQPLDLVFPAVLCLWLREAFARLASERQARRLGRLAAFEVGVDYLENALVRAMLKRPDGDFPDILANAASALTTLKWLLIAVLFGALLGLWRKRRRV